MTSLTIWTNASSNANHGTTIWNVFFSIGSLLNIKNWTILLLIHLFLMFQFCVPWVQKKTVRFSDIFKGYRTAILETNGLKLFRNILLLGTWHKLNINNTFRRWVGHPLNLLCMFHLRRVFRSSQVISVGLVENRWSQTTKENINKYILFRLLRRIQENFALLLRYFYPYCKKWKTENFTIFLS